MNVRALLFLLVLGCSGESFDTLEGDNVSGFPLAPWHMWGDSVLLTSEVDVNGGNTASGQLIRINYGRPETWSFFFAAELVDGFTGNPNMDVAVLIDVITGVGRTSFDTQAAGNVLAAPGFARFMFRFAGPFAPTPETVKKYTSVGSGPALDDTLAPAVFPSIDRLVAEDIQVRARVRSSGGPGDFAKVNITAFFAPRSHVRPEWWSDKDDHGRFRGNEQGGT
jgi:hypothetical protein